MKGVLDCDYIITFFSNRDKLCKLLLTKIPIVEELVEILEIFYEATMVSQKADFTLSDFYKCWVVVQLKLKSRTVKPTKTNLGSYLLKSLMKREHQIIDNSLMRCAMLLDPRFCDEIIDNQLADTKDLLVNIWNQMKAFRNHVDAAELTPEVAEKSSSADIFAQYIRNKLKKRNEDLNSTITDDEVLTSIDLFVKDEALQTTDDSWSIFKFWAEKKTKYPVLYELAMVIHAIAPTQVTVERNFSVLAYIFNSRRSNLLPKLLEDILMIVLNADLFEILNQENIDILVAKGN